MYLQKVRYYERLCFIKSISTEAALAFIPFFILQPLLENAIKYSVEQTDEQVTIELKGNVIEQKLRIQIINSHTTPLPIQHQGMGIGMKNIASRLEQYYKQEAILQMTTEAQHTIVTLSIPLYAK
jgi:LytS/YehU family sensor histidine kinase